MALALRHADLSVDEIKVRMDGACLGSVALLIQFLLQICACWHASLLGQHAVVDVTGLYFQSGMLRVSLFIPLVAGVAGCMRGPARSESCQWLV